MADPMQQSAAAQEAVEDARGVIEVLLTLAHAAQNVADSADGGDGMEDVTVDRGDFTDLSDALDALDELPDDQPGYTMEPAAKARWALRGILDAPVTAAPDDRGALLYLMSRFDAETWNCPKCGHAEDTATMDSADYLRRYLAENQAASASTPAAPGIDPALLQDPAHLHAAMLRGVVAIPSWRDMVSLRGEVFNTEEGQQKRIAELQERLALLAASSKGDDVPHRDLVPGVMRCAKCAFQLHRTNLYLGSGTTGPGDSKTEPCPNGCGPLWPVTWQTWATEGWQQAERYFEELRQLQDSPKGITAAGDVDAAALRRALADYPGRNTHQLQARKVCAGVLALAESYGAEAQNSPKDGNDTARLDSGMIRLSHRDEFGEDGYILHTGVNLRAAIDAAMQYQAGDAEVQP